MHRSARQARILGTLSREGACSLSELARDLEVSDETIRRDVTAMAQKGLVERVHGGVVLPEPSGEPAFKRRMQKNAAEKRQIATLAAARIRNGDAIVLDTGSTTAYVARALAEHRDLLVVTNCTAIAQSLAPRNRVYLAGGELRADDGAVFGPSAIAFVEQFRVRFAVLSIGAIHSEDGFMDFHLQEAEFSRATLKRATHTMVVADHSKFGTQAAVRVCGFEAVDILITDRTPSADLKSRFSEAGIEVLLPGNTVDSR